MIEYTLDCVSSCPDIDQFVVSTDSPDIAKTVEELGYTVPFLRPAELATHDVGKIGAIRHATQWAEQNLGISPQFVVDVDVTVPLRRPEDLTKCIRTLVNSDYDGVVSVFEAERNPYFNMVEPNADGSVRLAKQASVPILSRQAAPPVFSVSSAAFVFRRSRLDQIEHLYHGKWGACMLSRLNGIDIDTEDDWRFVEYLMA